MPKSIPEPHTRPPLARMLQIHERVRSGQFPNCNSLAKELETCQRTVLRDIEFMRSRLSLPIEYDDRRYGFYYSKPVDGFPSLSLSEAEAFGLLIAQKVIQQYRGTPFQEPLEHANRRLTRQLQPGPTCLFHDLERCLSFRAFAPDDPDLEKFQVLYQALSLHRRLRFRYRNVGAQRTLLRQVNPYHLACVESHWYLFAFDLGRDALRTFALTRMTDVKVLPQAFTPPADFDPTDYLNGSFSVFRGTDDFEVVIDFDRWAADLIRGELLQPVEGARWRFEMIAHEQGPVIADLPVHETPGQFEAGGSIVGTAELFDPQEDVLESMSAGDAVEPTATREEAAWYLRMAKGLDRLGADLDIPE